MFFSFLILSLVPKYSEQHLEVLTKFTNALKTGNRDELFSTLADNFKIIRCDRKEILKKEDLFERYKNIPGEHLFFNNFTVLEQTNYGQSILYMVNISGISMSFFEVANQKIISETQRNCEKQPITTSLINDPQMIASYTISRYLEALQNHSLIQDVLADDYQLFTFTLKKFNRTEYIESLTSSKITETVSKNQIKIGKADWTSDGNVNFFLEVYDNETNKSIAKTLFAVTPEYRISYESQTSISYEPFPELSALIDYGVELTYFEW